MSEPCPCCGDRGRERDREAVLWPELVEAWGLAPEEAAYVERQQGTRCRGCGSNLRTMALARAIVRFFRGEEPLTAFLAGPGRRLEVLEVNEAGGLTRFLSVLRGHRLTRHPDVDMCALPWAGERFDLVVHSDTLEHVPTPRDGLAECRRVLRAGGACAYTVPIVVDRLTRSREGLPPSYHGRPGQPDPGMLVRTEYGADAWKDALLAGFAECRVVALEYPAALALVAVR